MTLSPNIQVPPPGRRPTREVRIGSCCIGGSHPILIQSMTVSDTMDTEAVVAEIRELVEAGCPLIRLTTPSIREAENLREIRRRLTSDGIHVPMVADVHFTPNAALVAAEIVEKVRINPGNYADRKKLLIREYTDAQYAEELERVAERFRPLVRRLKETGAALRIGANHGSLSDRIMNRYGDTPEGMVQSALEFVRVCEAEGFRRIVLSMKSSVPAVMVVAYRLLVQRMDEAGMDYPLHLGVTEAGDGLEARIKSAAGIGSLLADGIGDTIRVSLAEDSRHEIPAAQAILEAAAREAEARPGSAPARRALPVSTARRRRRTAPWMLGELGIGGDFPVRVEERVALPVGAELPPAADAAGPAMRAEGRQPELLSCAPLISYQARPAELVEALDRFRRQTLADPSEGSSRTPPPLILEWTLRGQGEIHILESALPQVDALSVGLAVDSGGAIDLDESQVQDRLRLLARLLLRHRKPLRWRIPVGIPDSGPLALGLSEICRQEGLNSVGFLCQPGPGWIPRVRAVAEALADRPDLLFLEAPALGADAPFLLGSSLIDGLGDSICLIPGGNPWPSGGRTWSEDPAGSAYAILQGCRLRLTRAEFIACPSCGRTQFDLQATTAKIRARTEHLTGVKIAVMGCIVNGPGEMADADFGYVGSGPGRVDLYVGSERVRQGVPEAEASDRLEDLIREQGRWIDPPRAIRPHSA